MINATIEVRMTSSRLPGKIMMTAGGLSMLEILVRRLSNSNYIENIIVATTINKQDDPIVDFCKDNGILFYRGSEHNVLARVCEAAEKYDTDVLVQITGDCPLIDYQLVDDAIRKFLSIYPESRFVSNTGPEISMPWGFDVQIYKAKELREILSDSPGEKDRENVSHRFYLSEYSEVYKPVIIKYKGVKNRPELRVTLDHLEDYNLIKDIVEDFGVEKLNDYGIENIIAWLDNHPDKRDLVIKKHSE
jgi:spore coat polysaccharide biosynthesis protein SpsF